MDKRAASTRSVTVRIVSLPFENLAEMVCASCEAPLDFSQPDPVRTDRFLATCSECGDWLVVQHGENTATVQVVSLEPIAAELDRVKTLHRPVDG